MAITDIQISEELETNAPSIKYRGDEGPKSPQQIEQMMIQQGQEMDQIQNQEAGSEELMTAELDILKDEYLKYVFEMEEQGLQPMSFREFLDQTMAEKDMSSRGPIIPSDEDPINPFGPKPIGPPLPDRQMAAYGGIMGLDGRRKYGIGSSLKKLVRKVIPNEVAKVAEVAAPFVAMAAPQFALPAALAGGLGRFDRTGSLGDSLKSGLTTYGLGTLSPGLPGVRDMGPQSGMFTTQPFGGRYNVSNLFKSKAPVVDQGLTEVPAGLDAIGSGGLTEVPAGETFVSKVANPEKLLASQQDKFSLLDIPTKVKNALQAAGLGNNLVTGLLVGGLGAGALMDGMTEEEQIEIGRGGNLDIEGIRTEVLEAMKDPTGEALKAIRIKYPFLGTQRSKNLDAIGKAMGGRIGFSNGGDYENKFMELVAQLREAGFSQQQAIEEARKRLGNDMAMGGRIGFEFGERVPPVKMPDPIERMLQNMTDEEKAQFKLMMRMNAERMPKYQPDPNAIPPVKMPTYPRVDRAEGGIMDLGGMEKDYRAEGGFVPIGREEKADDVPARLSVNEFVFTADAVRNAGGGDIDKGAEVMENMMKNLEAGGQVSEESQGMQGAQQMFETSERLSEVM